MTTNGGTFRLNPNLYVRPFSTSLRAGLASAALIASLSLPLTIRAGRGQGLPVPPRHVVGSRLGRRHVDAPTGTHLDPGHDPQRRALPQRARLVVAGRHAGVQGVQRQRPTHGRRRRAAQQPQEPTPPLCVSRLRLRPSTSGVQADPSLPPPLPAVEDVVRTHFKLKSKVIAAHIDQWLAEDDNRASFDRESPGDRLRR